MQTESSSQILLPRELVQEIDADLGADARESFIIESVRLGLKRRRLLALVEGGPIWKDEDHPELAELGTAEWLRRQRLGNQPREDGIVAHLREDES